MELWLSSPGLVSGDGDGFQGAQADSDSKSSQKVKLLCCYSARGLASRCAPQNRCVERTRVAGRLVRQEPIVDEVEGWGEMEGVACLGRLPRSGENSW